MTVASIIGYILGGIASIVLMVLVCVFVAPRGKRKSLKNKFLVFLHDMFNFRGFWIENILKYAYIWATIVTVCLSVFMIPFSWETGYDLVYDRWTESDKLALVTKWTGYWWILALIIGPIIIRIAYEVLLMIPVAVRNLIEINQKTKVQPEEVEEEKVTQEDSPLAEQEELIVSCTLCGGKMIVPSAMIWAKAKCPHCNEVTIVVPEDQ